MNEYDDFDSFLRNNSKKAAFKPAASTTQPASANTSGSRAKIGGSAQPISAGEVKRQTGSSLQGHSQPNSTRPVRPVSANSNQRSQYSVPRPEQFQSPAQEQFVPGNRRPNPTLLRQRQNKKFRLKSFRITLILLLIIALAWPLGLALWADSKIEHVAALSDAADTSGTTYLVAGADIADEGAQRTDTLMLMHKAPNGNSYLTSIPRDTLVDIPGYGGYKINAAYSFGGPELLVQTVEALTGFKVDHFILVGFDSVISLVDAVGTVNLCIDQDVNDERSGLVMTAGCHDMNGEQALSFVRARYFDPTADIGRQSRQQQFISAFMKEVASPGVLLNPISQMKLVHAGGSSITTDSDTGLFDLASAALVMRSATSNDRVVQLPVENPNFQTRNSGVALLLDEAELSVMLSQIADGTL